MANWIAISFLGDGHTITVIIGKGIGLDLDTLRVMGNHIMIVDCPISCAVG
jgi:hypothetical protein